jgi:hypothetical protein
VTPHFSTIYLLFRSQILFSGVLAETEREKGKKLCSLSPPSGALRRIGAVANEERSGPQFD